MKALGIIGGIGPESTIDYYRSLVAAYRERRPDDSYPPLIINSVDLTKLRGLVEAGDLAGVADYLVAEIRRLEAAGAEFGLIAANTPHLVFDEVQRQTTLPLISIVQATCDAALELGMKKLGLLGTRFVMQGSFYPLVFSKAALTLVAPDEAAQHFIHEKYFSELVKGVFLPETHDGLAAIVKQMKEREQIDGVILGGTELPLILKERSIDGVRLLDTTQIHVQAAIGEMLK